MKRPTRRALARTGATLCLLGCTSLLAPQPAWALWPAPTGMAMQPFDAASTGSKLFRIPGIVTLDNGWLVATGDARWGSGKDSAHNIDGLVSISKDGGATWEWSMVNHFVDYADFSNPKDGAATNEQRSASFIDPAIVQGADGRVYMLVDMLPARAGNTAWSYLAAGTGHDEAGNLLICKAAPDSDASTAADDYLYIVDEGGAAAFAVDGTTMTLRPIVERAGGAQTGYWVDAQYDLYAVDADGAEPVMCDQYRTDTEKSGTQVQANVFYRQSEWKAFPTFYTWLRTGTVTQDGIDWDEGRIINVKREDEKFLGVCPGRGSTWTGEDGTERVMFQVYSNASGTEQASTVYSDDGGLTWNRGQDAGDFSAVGAGQKSSESQIVTLPDGTLRMYSRSALMQGPILYADSADGGRTWSAYQPDNELQWCGETMISAINVAGSLTDANGTTWENLIAISYPKGQGTKARRKDGTVRIGSIDAATGSVTWLNSDDVRFAGIDADFCYSCLTQVAGNELGLVWEPSNSPLSVTIRYERSPITGAGGLMDEGWTYIAPAETEKPDGDGQGGGTEEQPGTGTEEQPDPGTENPGTGDPEPGKPEDQTPVTPDGSEQDTPSPSPGPASDGGNGTASGTTPDSAGNPAASNGKMPAANRGTYSRRASSAIPATGDATVPVLAALTATGSLLAALGMHLRRRMH